MSRESQTLKKGDLIVIENTDNLIKPINEFHKKWEVTEMKIDFGAAATPAGVAMANAVSMASMYAYTAGPTACVSPATATATERQTGKQVKLKYYGLGFKPFENRRLVGIVTEILKEERPDLDFIKVREQKGGFRYCRRYILENV